MNYFDLRRKINNGFYKLVTQFIYRFMFNSIGKNTKIIKPLLLRNTKYISIGSNVTINEQIFMQVECSGINNQPSLSIGNGTTIGHFNHIVCCDKIEIGENVLLADRIYISDNVHNYEDITSPISHQGIKSRGKVVIGDNTWVGENVSIISVCVGKNCVIGANSVVTHDVPDYSVVVGAPAKIVKQYDFEKGFWVKINE